jgi:hypothetical protein
MMPLVLRLDHFQLLKSASRSSYGNGMLPCGIVTIKPYSSASRPFAQSLMEGRLESRHNPGSNHIYRLTIVTVEW